MPERRDGRNRSANEAHVDDILDAFGKLEVAGQLPSFAVLAEHLHFVPRARPEEIDVISLVDRVSAVEESLAALKGAVRPDDERPRTAQCSEPSMGGSLSANRRFSRPLDRRFSSVWDVEQQPRPRSSSRGSATAPKHVHGGPSMAEMAARNADVPFQEVSYKKKNVRKRCQKGTAGNSESLKGGSDTFCVQITNVNPAVQADDITKFASNGGVGALKVEEATTEGWPTKRFRVTFPQNAYDTVMNVEFWPSNVYFRQFFMPRGKGSSRSNNNG